MGEAIDKKILEELRFVREKVIDMDEELHRLRKQIKKAPETALLSEKALAKDWLSKEEDEAWKNL